MTISVLYKSQYKQLCNAMHKQHLWLLLLISAVIYWPFLGLYYIVVAGIKSKQPTAFTKITNWEKHECGNLVVHAKLSSGYWYSTLTHTNVQDSRLAGFLWSVIQMSWALQRGNLGWFKCQKIIWMGMFGSYLITKKPYRPREAEHE